MVNFLKSITSIGAGNPPKPLILSKAPQSTKSTWSSAESWFGGRPRLRNAEEWPRHPRLGTPLHCAAQVELSTINRLSGAGALVPSEGAIAVFLSTREDLIFRIVPAISDPAAAFTDPPADLPSVGDEMHDRFWPRMRDSSSRLHSRWPIVPWAHSDTIETEFEMSAVVEAEFGGRKYSRFSPFGSLDRWLPDSNAVLPRLPWETAQRYSAALSGVRDHFANARENLVTGTHGDLREISVRAAQVYDELLDAAQRFPQGRHPWTLMDESEVAMFLGYCWRLREGLFGTIRPSAAILDDLSAASAKALCTASDYDTTRLLPDLAAQVDDFYRVPGKVAHQMFGPGADVQGVGVNDGPDILLLQLVEDDLLDWYWGGAVLQFWITESDLRAGRWENARGSHASL